VSDELVYLSKFWPTPPGPASANVELNVTLTGPNTYSYTAKVELRDGSSQGRGGGLEAKTKEEAQFKAMFKLVTLLGEMLADALERNRT
jgi:hypothetical protein